MLYMNQALPLVISDPPGAPPAMASCTGTSASVGAVVQNSHTALMEVFIHCILCRLFLRTQQDNGLPAGEWVGEGAELCFPWMPSLFSSLTILSDHIPFLL